MGVYTYSREPFQCLKVGEERNHFDDVMKMDEP